MVPPSIWHKSQQGGWKARYLTRAHCPLDPALLPWSLSYRITVFDWYKGINEQTVWQGHQMDVGRIEEGILQAVNFVILLGARWVRGFTLKAKFMVPPKRTQGGFQETLKQSPVGGYWLNLFTFVVFHTHFFICHFHHLLVLPSLITSRSCLRMHPKNGFCQSFLSAWQGLGWAIRKCGKQEDQEQWALVNVGQLLQIPHKLTWPFKQISSILVAEVDLYGPPVSYQPGQSFCQK